MSTLIVIPAYNEEESIVSTVTELLRVCPDCSYVIINDGSRDDTSRLCHEHNYNVIDLPSNLGLTGAFQTGMIYAYRHKFDNVIQFDADGQHDPRYLEPMVALQQESNADIVIGSRFVSEDKPHSLRMLGSNLISALLKITTGKTIKDPTSGMRLYHKPAIELFATRSDLSPEPDTLAFLIKKRRMNIIELQVSMRERTAGESYLTLSKSISYMLNACISIAFSLWFRR